MEAFNCKRFPQSSEGVPKNNDSSREVFHIQRQLDILKHEAFKHPAALLFTNTYIHLMTNLVNKKHEAKKLNLK